MQKFKSRFDALERQIIVEKSVQFIWSADGKLGLEYLKSRHLNEETIRLFNVGYLPADLLHQLAGRIILPLYDASGHLISIASRSMPGHDDNLPVYWHEAYEKSFYLYGMHKTRNFIRNQKYCIVVEGQFDFLHMYNDGFYNAVAMCGKSLSLVQLSTIHRYADTILLMTDKDENKSGQKSMREILKKHTSQKKYPDGYGTHIIPVEFEDFGDPDEFLTKFGPLQMRTLIDQSLKKK